MSPLTDENLSRAFHEVDIPPGRSPRDLIDESRAVLVSRASRRRTIGIVGVFAATLAVAVGASTLGSVTTPSSLSAAGQSSTSAAQLTSVLDWPSRGDRVADRDLISSAISAAGVAVPEKASVLYAGNFKNGESGLVVLVSDDAAAGKNDQLTNLWFVERANSMGSTAQLLSHFTVSNLARYSAVGYIAAPSPDRTSAVALLAPGVKNAQFEAAMMEAPDSDSAVSSSTAADGLLTSGLAQLASPWNTYVSTDLGSISYLAMGTTSPQYLPVKVNTTGQLTLQSTAGVQLKVGDVVANAARVLGVVAEVDEAGAAVVDTTAEALNSVLDCYSYISNHEGGIKAAADGGLEFVPNDPDITSDVNRVLCRPLGADAPTLGLGQTEPSSMELRTAPAAEADLPIFVVQR